MKTTFKFTKVMTSLKRTLMLLPLLLLGLGAMAQGGQDVVFLQDGNSVVGTVTEYVSGDHVTIRTAEGAVFRFAADEVAKLKLKTAGQGAVTLPESGYFNQSSLNLIFGSPYGYVDAGAGLQMINGYQFGGRYYAGIGTGLEAQMGRAVMPLFGSFRVDLRKARFSPFVQAMAGYNVLLSGRERYNYWSGFSGSEKGGFMTGADLGIRHYASSQFGFFSTIGYRYQVFQSSYDSGFWNGEDFVSMPVEETSYTHRILFGIGIFFH